MSSFRDHLRIQALEAECVRLNGEIARLEQLITNKSIESFNGTVPRPTLTLPKKAS